MDQFALAECLTGHGDTGPDSSDFYMTGRQPDATQRKPRGHRWVDVLASLVKDTPAPMGPMFPRNPGRVQLIVAGRRVSTLRARVRAIRRCSNWLTINHDVIYSPPAWSATQVICRVVSLSCDR